METMHPVVLHGCSTWDKELLPLDEFTIRLQKIQNDLQEKNLKGAIIYSDVRNYAKVCYFSNYIPKHSYAILLIPAIGEPRLLAKLAGIRDIPYVQTLTWIEDIRAVKNLENEIREFLEQIATSDAQENSKPTVGICGNELMTNKVYKDIISAGEFVNFEEIDSHLDSTLRQKRPREKAVINEAVSLLQHSVVAMKEVHRREGSVVTAMVEAEQVARNYGAQDVRILFSLDYGKTLQPLETISEVRNDPMIAYIAIDYLGYWVEGMVTLIQQPNEIYDQTITLLNNLKKSLVSGASISSIIKDSTKSIAPYELHPVSLGGYGYNIGLSLKEKPLLHENYGNDVIQEGDIYSLHACLTNGKEEHCLLSSIISINKNGNEILWSSLKN
ncbi:aminopeptidase P family N-terminal domain-containing protein [Bacillus sp. Marseille-P3661]|uniref:aminopeptidase P family N-terminal domain-containing protein n=1 Tax=Bacillus sp. Marseille-P3661 TaxID=1936234 RepID=UPI000C84A18E|nr:aminopeptidase P family N-terminal domain-containing protein [Bacillus sp. Marseille-P3661]